MPRPTFNHSEQFSYAHFGEWLIVSSSNNELNTRSFQCFTKFDEGVFHGPPPMTPSFQRTKTSGMFSSILDRSLFFRYEYIESHLLAIELFLYMHEEFVELGRYDCSKTGARHGTLLNENIFLVTNEEYSFLDLRTMQLHNLPLTMNSDVPNRIMAQNDKIYFFDPKAKLIKEQILFDELGMPYIFSEHCLMNVSYHGIDRTPGDNHFILKQGQEYFTCYAEFGKVVTTPITFSAELLSDGMHYAVVIYRIHDTVLRSPYFIADNDLDIRCALWRFIYINGAIHYVDRKENRRTLFFPILKSELRGMFSLHKKSIIGQHIPKQYSCMRRIMWSFLNNKLFIVHPLRPLKFMQLIRKTVPFYKETTQEWGTCCITDEEDDMYIIYIDGKETMKYAKYENDGDNFAYLPAACNDKHSIFIRSNDHLSYDLFVCNHYVGTCQFISISLSGNYLWFAEEVNTLRFLELNEDGSVLNRKRIMFQSNICNIICNVYVFPEAIIVFGDSEHQDFLFVRIYDDGVIEYKPLFKGTNNVMPFFVDVGIVVYRDKLYNLNDIDNITVLKLPKYLNRLNRINTSPKLGHIVSYKREMTNYKVEMNTMTFNDGFTDFEEIFEEIDIVQYLSNCDVCCYTFC
ncbi:hypothetical protein PCE1_000455 [Barthelona sp. PCE]